MFMLICAFQFSSELISSYAKFVTDQFLFQFKICLGNNVFNCMAMTNIYRSNKLDLLMETQGSLVVPGGALAGNHWCLKVQKISASSLEIKKYFQSWPKPSHVAMLLNLHFYIFANPLKISLSKTQMNWLNYWHECAK